ncbi:hypothetical protein DQ244_12105 [Blastococcus sp. TBT05-19]|uniref:STAS domain-containing protein n=1 Tax=Blastococcus sp. TBT05-19 TaxID=2250581 RepID=UPI000DEB305F|nr:STAS domain-containing protein [Blastococcus sp. TBT05-19]RBY90206.1 hypothetical protein DQ244_12105 [Blastococcus sp. TBT05-19]
MTDQSAFSEQVDGRTGVVRARGHLTVQAADLLSGTASTLHREGHRQVLLDLQAVQRTDDAGLELLEQLRTTIAARGGRVVVIAPRSAAES